MRYYLTRIRMGIIKKSTNNKSWRGCGEKGNFLYCCWKCKWIQLLWKTVWIPLKKKLGIKLPYDPTIPLLGIYPEKNIIEKDTCAPVFTAAQFKIAGTWKQPKCPSTDEWLKKLWCIYTMEYYSAIEGNTSESILVKWKNLEPIIQSEISQKEKNKYCILMYFYGNPLQYYCLENPMQRGAW